MKKHYARSARLALFALMAGVAQPALAENWIQIYADSEARASYDADNILRTGDGTLKVMFRMTFNQAQHPEPESSIPESTTFYTRQQYNEIDCANQTMSILGVWYLDYSGQILGGSEGRSPPYNIRQGTVGGLLSQYLCR